MEKTYIEEIKDKLDDLEGYLFNSEKLLRRINNFVAIIAIILVIVLFKAF